MHGRQFLTISLVASLALLAGCDLLGLPDPKTVEAEGKATGAACRQAGRALADCYQLNPTLSKAAIFQGWRDMNDYMTEQKLDVVQPALAAPLPKGVKPIMNSAAAASAPAADASEAAAAPEASAASEPAKMAAPAVDKSARKPRAAGKASGTH